jgi:DNA-binding PadR family transcriptional regulator
VSTSTRLLVLGVVRIFQPVHGYDVRRELLSWRADEWGNVSPGSIYNALKSLTRDGLLEVVGTAHVGGRPERTTYKLTSEGESEFARLLRDAWWTVQSPIDPLMPALSFMWALTRDELTAVLKHRMTQVEGMRRQLQFSVNDIRNVDTKPAHVAEMLHLMDARIAAEVAWAETLLARLGRGEYVTADDPPSKWQPQFRPKDAAAKKKAKGKPRAKKKG